MIIDLHSHIIPKTLLNNEVLDIKLERLVDGGFALKVWDFSINPIKDNMFEPELQIQEMAEEGIDVKVLSSPPFLFGYDKELAWGKNWVQIYNNALAEVCDQYPGKFLGLGIVPMQDSDTAVVEMKRCLKELGFAGIEIGTNVNGFDLDDERFSGFFQEANRLQCNILVHPNNILARSRFSNYYLSNLVGNPVETTIAVSRTLVSGFFDKYPDINVCFSHGGGAFPYVFSRIKHGMNVRPEIISLSGSSLPKGIYFDCVLHHEKTLAFLIDVCGMERVVLGSDYPFDMGITYPVEFIAKAAGKKGQSMILKENPIKFLRMGKSLY